MIRYRHATAVMGADQTLRVRLTVEAVSLCGVLLVAAVLRFYNLSHQGFMVFDDAAFVVAARYIVKDASREAEVYGTSPWTIKMSHSYSRPGFIILVIGSALLMGWSPFAGALVSAVLGLMTVLLVYGIARQFFERRAALLAAALLATSSWHIFHSRVGLSNATAVFFFTAGFFWWLRFSTHRSRAVLAPFIAGLLFGYAFTCHYSLLLLLSVGLVVELWQAIRVRAYRGTVLLLVGGLLPFVGFSAFGGWGYQPWKEVLRLSQGVHAPPDPLYYFRLLWRHETFLFVIFSALGALRAVWKFKQARSNREGSLWALCLISFILLSIMAAMGNARPRLIAFLFPLLAVLSGGAATLLLDSALFRRGGTLLWGATVGLILLAGMVSNRGFFTWRSGFEEAARYLHTHYPGRQYACTGWWPICGFYWLGPQVTSAEELQAWTPQVEFVFAHSMDRVWERGVFGALPGTLVAQFENPIERDPRIEEEIGPGGGSTLGVIRLYDLRPSEAETRRDPTPLMLAAAAGQTTQVTALLARGAEVEARDRAGATALLYAAIQGQAATLTALLDRGADVHVRDKEGATALLYAAARGHTGTVTALLERGADPREGRNAMGATALMLAITHGDPATVTALLDRGGEVQARNDLGQTAVMLAARYGRTTIVQTLLDRGADLEARDKKGTTVLMFAAAFGHPDTVAALLARGADVRLRDSIGRTAFMMAVLNRHTDVLQLLKQAGAEE